MKTTRTSEHNHPFTAFIHISQQFTMIGSSNEKFFIFVSLSELLTVCCYVRQFDSSRQTVRNAEIYSFLFRRAKRTPISISTHLYYLLHCQPHKCVHRCKSHCLQFWWLYVNFRCSGSIHNVQIHEFEYKFLKNQFISFYRKMIVID